MSSKKIVVAVTGASGAIYADILLRKLQVLKNQHETVEVVFSDNARMVWEHEKVKTKIQDIPFKIYPKNDFTAPFASGSAGYTHMIIVPCSMGTLGRIAAGVSDELISRAADVMLKERKKLILVTRETPLNLIHIRNMETVTLAGGIICPANPSYYSNPSTIEELAGTVINRVLDLCGFELDYKRWGKKPNS